MTDNLLWIDSSGRIAAANEPACQTLGYPRPELLHRPVGDVIPQWTSQVWQQHWKILQSGQLLHAQVEYRAKNQDCVRAMVTLEEMASPQAKYGTIAWRSPDDTTIQTAFLDRAPDTLYRYRLHGDRGFDYISLAIERLMGYAPEDYYADPTLLFHQIHPEDRLQLEQRWQSPSISSSPLVLRWRHRNGQIVWTEQRDILVCDAKGNGIAIEGILRDITERHQSELALRQQAERERLVSAIAQRIRQSLNLEDILQTTVTEVRQFLNSDRVLIYRFDSNPSANADCKGVVVVESVENTWEPMLGSEIPVALAARELQYYLNGCTQIFDNTIEEIESTLHPLVKRFQVKSSLIVPILLKSTEGIERGLLWGLLVAHQCSQHRHWQSIEVELLEQLATQAAIAIQQSHLFEQVQRQGAELELQIRERTEQLQQALEFEAMLKRITDKVRDSLDESQIVQTAVREVAVVLGVGSCNAALYDLDRGTSTICYEYANFIPASQGRVSQMGNFPEIYTQLMDRYDFQFCSLIPNPVRGRVAMLASPMFDNQGVLGDLWLVHQAEYIFSELEIRLVQQVANQCAIAIRQARLYQAAQTQVAELEKLNRLKDDFLSAVSHELRTPIANMKLAIEMLKHFAPTDPNNPPEDPLTSSQISRIQRYLNILNTECTREEELVEDLLDLQRLENDAYAISLSRIDLNEWIPNLARPFYTRISDRSLGLHVNCPENLPEFVCDRINLERILVELLNNACKYTPMRGDIHFDVSECEYRDDEDSEPQPGICFRVRNQATIPPEELPKIFQKFYRIPNSDPWKQGGTGLGLALIEKLVVQLGGRIDVTSEGGWTTFELVFPNTREVTLEETDEVFSPEP